MFPTITLESISESASGKAATVNTLLDAMSAAALFGIKSISGLVVNFYGGNMNVAGVPTAVATQQITLTASATNYIYATSSGTVTKVTSPPSGWPGPLAAGAIALLSFVTGTATITSATNYLTGTAAKGDTGATGATGPAGTDLAGSRKRLWAPVGNTSSVIALMGFSTATLTGATLSSRTASSSSFRESIPYAGYQSAASAGSSAQVHHPQTFCYLGNAAGRGGFTVSMRFCMENSVNASPANMRSFFGLFVPGSIGNVEPDTLTNIIGVGSLAGDANFRVFNNDGSGTATKTAFTTPGNFPVQGTDNVYELVITSVANSGTVSLTLTDMATGNTQSFPISTDLPSNTTFLSWVAWVNNGSTASIASMGMMQVVGETRY
jgi:hypothetical protein